MHRTAQTKREIQIYRKRRRTHIRIWGKGAQQSKEDIERKNRKRKNVHFRFLCISFGDVWLRVPQSSTHDRCLFSLDSLCVDVVLRTFWRAHFRFSFIIRSARQLWVIGFMWSATLHFFPIRKPQKFRENRRERVQFVTMPIGPMPSINPYISYFRVGNWMRAP